MPSAEWYGVHEQIIAENRAGANTLPEHELLPIWDAEQRCFIWGIRERRAH